MPRSCPTRTVAWQAGTRVPNGSTGIVQEEQSDLEGSSRNEGGRGGEVGSPYRVNVVIMAKRYETGMLSGFEQRTRDMTDRECAAEELRAKEVTIRGRSGPMIVRTVIDAKTLSSLIDDLAVVAA